MGHNASAVHGVKSDDFYKPGNAINEIWLGKLEIISRLPFGDSDMAQAGWPKGDFPKIPWHQFIIPLKQRDLEQISAAMNNVPNCTCAPASAVNVPDTEQAAERLSLAFFLVVHHFSLAILVACILCVLLRKLNSADAAEVNTDNNIFQLANRRFWRTFFATLSLLLCVNSALTLSGVLRGELRFWSYEDSPIAWVALATFMAVWAFAALCGCLCALLATFDMWFRIFRQVWTLYQLRRRADTLLKAEEGAVIAFACKDAWEAL